LSKNYNDDINKKRNIFDKIKELSKKLRTFLTSKSKNLISIEPSKKEEKEEEKRTLFDLFKKKNKGGKKSKKSKNKKQKTKKFNRRK
jgi:hypothetical protein